MTKVATHERISPLDLPEIITPQQLADAIGSHPNVIRRQCESKVIPAVKVGRKWCISRDIVLGDLISQTK